MLALVSYLVQAGSGKQRKKSKVSESDSEKVEDMEDDAIEEEEEEEEEKCQEGDNSMDTSQIVSTVILCFVYFTSLHLLHCIII